MCTMSSTIKANLNSSSNGCSLADLKKHINTCLQRWQKKNSTNSHEQDESEYHHHQVSAQEEQRYCEFQEKCDWKFGKHVFKDYSFIEHTAVYWKSFNTKLQKIIRKQQRVDKENSSTYNDNKGPRKYGRRVEIVAKLLSSTLIERKSTKRKDSFSSSSTSDFYEDKMTITDLTFLELREEYPDINSEIRSILLSHAQEGATISQIRDDYRKLTGLIFPVYEDITEFLLTIPYVTAYCNEKGTRIFNIMPIDKTKHIHDMVMHQKPPAEPQPQRPKNVYYRERTRNTNYQPSSWRRNTKRTENNENCNVEPEPPFIKHIEQRERFIPSVDNNLSSNGSEDCEENNYFYQDNCNYLFKRICNPQQEILPSQFVEKTTQKVQNPYSKTLTNGATAVAVNNFNVDMASYKSNINHLNNLFQLQHQQHSQYQQNFNNLRAVDIRRPSINAMPLSSRSSSPTFKSWYTADSVYTDSDYEAHLLDFLLLGDDFFLYMARMELRCKFKKNERVLQSGFCVSGQTIGAAIRRIRALGEQRRSIILNIGSVDIMQGRQLIQIEHDFRELILIMLKKGIKPILTTLAPLANHSHNNEVKRMLERFNNFIKREGHRRTLIVIDVWKCLVNEKGHVMFDCYQNEPRNVTGTTEPYLFWNKIGRQRVLQLIESKLEY